MNLIDFFKLFGNLLKIVYNLIMETIEITQKPQEIAKNQIAFDFDNLPVEEEIQEESSILPEEVLSNQNYDWVADDFLFVVVKTQEENLGKDICGRPSLDWVLMAGGNCQKLVVEDSENIIDRLKNIQTEKPYIAVFYSDTPLIYKNLVFKIADYFVRNRLNAMTLLRGYVFKISYLQNIENFILGCLDKFDEKAFTRVIDGKTLASVYQILQNRILDYHEKNGVCLLDKSNITIDADVEIENGVVIKRGNVLKGNTYIGKNCYLQENNIVVNSILGEGVTLLGCKVLDSKIIENKTLSCQEIISKEV